MFDTQPAIKLYTSVDTAAMIDSSNKSFAKTTDVKIAREEQARKGRCLLPVLETTTTTSIYARVQEYKRSKNEVTWQGRDLE